MPYLNKSQKFKFQTVKKVPGLAETCLTERKIHFRQKMPPVTDEVTGGMLTS
jgi:hypothetical protein